MRSATLALLVVIASVASGGSGSGAAFDLGPRPTARGSMLAYVWDGRPSLVRVDAVTLVPRGSAVELAGKPPISTWVRSPAGDRLVLGSGDRSRLTFVDLSAMRLDSSVDLDQKGYVAGLAWPTRRGVVAARSGLSTEIVVVDPVTRRVVRRHRLAGIVTQAARSPRGLVLLLSPRGRLGRATLAVATPTRLRTATLPLEAGADPQAVFAPGLAVSGDGRRALVVPGGARVLDVDLGTLAIAERHLSEPVSRLGRLRAWLEPAAAAKGPLEGPLRSAAWVDRDRVVVAGSNYRPTGERSMVTEAAGVRLIDVGNWSVRTLAGGASAATVAGDTVLASGGTYGPSGLRGIGLRGFDGDGRERFHLFGDRFVAAVTAVGRYAYVSEQSETETTIEVVELASGRIVRTVRAPTYTEVLRPD